MLVKDQKPPEDILAADLKNVPRMKKKCHWICKLQATVDLGNAIS